MDINEALELIHQYCRPGGVVLDLFCGTMVTGMAALRLNRMAVMADVDKQVVVAANKRMARFYKWCKMNGTLPPIGTCLCVVRLCLISFSPLLASAQSVALLPHEKHATGGYSKLANFEAQATKHTGRTFPLSILPDVIPGTLDDEARAIGMYLECVWVV